jgi:hypothetical protein
VKVRVICQNQNRLDFLKNRGYALIIEIKLWRWNPVVERRRTVKGFA